MHFRTILIAVSASILACLLSASSALAGCNPYPNHWYARATSGCCAAGTDLDTTMPGSNAYICCSSTSDEAAWLQNRDVSTNAIECGWFIGYWPYGSHGVYNQFRTYMTTENGNITGRGIADIVGISIPANSNLKMQATNLNNCWFASSTNGQYGEYAGYQVSNGVNSGQGEVTSDSRTCMGGCSPGETFNAFWTPNGTTWNAWAYMTTCSDSPYWITTSGSYVYTN